MMFFTSRMTSKGQLTLPAKVRKRLGIGTGDTVIFDFNGDSLVLRKARNIEDYFGSLPPLDISYKEKLEEEIANDIWRDQ